MGARLRLENSGWRAWIISVDDTQFREQFIPQKNCVKSELKQVAIPTADIRSLARAHTSSAIRTLAAICAKKPSDGARVAAAGILLDRGWGKAPQNHTGSDGEGDIRVTIRHIIEGKGEPLPTTIDAVPIKAIDPVRD
jgi:hypothetical protein